MQTGENEMGLRKIIDLSRLISLVILGLHDYYYCYRSFVHWKLSTSMTDQLLLNIEHAGLFRSFHTSKWLALVFLMISLIGAKGKKAEGLQYRTALWYMMIGMALYFGSYLLIKLPLPPDELSIVYMVVCAIGFVLILTGGTLLSRVIQWKINQQDIFNKENQTFPQEERLLQNEYSINLPAEYHWKGKKRRSWINVTNVFRGTLILGNPGSGKSWLCVNNFLRQHIQKGFSMFVYDFKFDDLTVIAYNQYLKHKHRYTVEPKFYVINFDDLSRSHRCNPYQDTIKDITDAAESSRTILLGLNREWIKRQGDFFVESPINFVTALIGFLRKYNNGEFLTVPHVIELAQVEYDKLFSILRTEPEIEVLINPFVSAYLNDAMEQLEGQIAAAKISLARLSSPQLYYILSGNDFTLDINNPEAPKIVCMGNNPQKIQTYGAVLSLYVNRLTKVVNQKGKLKSSLIFDEFPTIYLSNIDSLIATARSNKVSTCLAVQDFSQLKKDYGRDMADVIMNITGNIIAGQVTGDTAKQLSDRFGKIMQDRTSYSINSSDTSISRSRQLDNAIPPSAISSLSSGEFVGMVADDPALPIDLKAFHARILRADQGSSETNNGSKPIPLIRDVSIGVVQKVYMQIKADVGNLVYATMGRMISDPELTELTIHKSRT